MKNQRPRKRKTEKTNGKDVFVCIPDDQDFYLKLSLAKAPPKPLLAPELELYFSRHGVARFYDENGLFLEIWMGARKVRIGTQADIGAFIKTYYDRQGEEMPPDLTPDQLILGYATSAFVNCYQMKMNGNQARSQGQRKS